MTIKELKENIQDLPDSYDVVIGVVDNYGDELIGEIRKDANSTFVNYIESTFCLCYTNEKLWKE
jgi:hypothetical protein